MGTKDRDLTLAELVRADGFSFEMLRALARAVERRGGTMADLRRIISDHEMTGRIASLLMEEHPTIITPSAHPVAVLPPNHYLIRVNRGPLPPYEQLLKNFPGGVCEHLFKSRYVWIKHPCRLGAKDLTDELVEVFVKEFSDEEIRAMGGKLESDLIIQWGLRNGWLPADEEECHAVGIDPLTRDLQLKNPLVALGSSRVRRGDRVVSVLRARGGERVFDSRWFACEWPRCYRFLFVRRVQQRKAA